MKQQGQRDRAILAVLLYHGPRREEAVLLQVSDIQERRGIQHLKVHGKGGKVCRVTTTVATVSSTNFRFVKAGCRRIFLAMTNWIRP